MTDFEIDAKIVKQFNKTAESYSKDIIFSQGIDLEIILTEVNADHKMTVLDVATGAGHVAMKIAPFVKSVNAIDITPKMIEILKQNIQYKNIKNIVAEIMPADNLEFKEDTFDVITCRFATHHFTNVKKFLSEIKRVLKPNGKLILVDIIAPETKSMNNFVNHINKLRDNSHVKQCSEAEWESIFVELNFNILNKQNNPLTHDLDSWFARAKTSNENMEKIVDAFNSSSEAKIQFQFDSKIKSFVEESMIFTLQI